MKKALSVISIILVVCMFSFFAIASGEDEKKEISSDPSDAVVIDKDTTNGKADAKTAKVGDTVTTNDVKITFVSAEIFNDYNEYLPPKDGYVFYRLEFSCENISDRDVFVSMYDFNCYADDVAMDQHYEGDDLSATLSAGRKATGFVYFEVKEDAKNIQVEYESNVWTDSKIVFDVK